MIILFMNLLVAIHDFLSVNELFHSTDAFWRLCASIPQTNLGVNLITHQSWFLLYEKRNQVWEHKKRHRISSSLTEAAPLASSKVDMMRGRYELFISSEDYD